MFLPLFILVIAFLSAAVVGYGTHAGWGDYGAGLNVILLSRRWQWPLVLLSLAACMTLIGLVISGRRRAWWLIGLAPVMALFVHRFTTGPAGRLAIVDGPVFVDAARADAFLGADEYVVGLKFEGVSYAYPYTALACSPVILQSDHDKRMLLMWSPRANRAVAIAVDRKLRGRDLEIISSPADALLVYNVRIGQFVNAVTGLTPGGERPPGFRESIPTSKMPWRIWRLRNPETLVLSDEHGSVPTAAAPQLPTVVQPGAGDILPADTPILFIEGSDEGPTPLALPMQHISAAPLNLRGGNRAVLVFRDAAYGEVRVFDRRVEEDLIATFRPNQNARRKGAVFYYGGTDTGWNADGVAVTGRKEFKGRRLTPLPADEDVYWGVMKHWYPDLLLAETSPASE